MHQDRGILLVRLGGLGDVIFTLPAVHALRDAFPKARFTFLTYSEFAPLLEGFPHIDAVLTVDRSRYRGLNAKAIAAETFSLLRSLRRSRFGLAIDFQGFGETGLLTWWTRAPQRWGSVYRPGRGWAYTQGVRRDLCLHPIDYHLELIQKAGGISANPMRNHFVVPGAAAAEARRRCSEWNLVVGKPTLFIQPFSNGDDKNWPLTHYVATARHWRDQGLQVIFGGGPADRSALEAARQEGFAVAAGTPLLVSAGLVSLSTVILGADTGLLHLAIAMGKRVVMIISSTQPGKCFPFAHPDWSVMPADHVNIGLVKCEAVNDACARALTDNGISWAHPASGLHSLQTAAVDQP